MKTPLISGIAALLPLCVLAANAQAAIYRCAQADGSVLYADYPCQGGAIVDVHPGTADPNAKERLARAQQALDRAAADRRAREQFDAARREAEGPQNLAPPSPVPNDALSGTAYDFYAPIAAYAPNDRFRRGDHRASRKPVQHEKRVPQVVRTPHPPR